MQNSVFFSHKMLRKCEVRYSLTIQIKVIGRTKAVTRHFLQKSFKNINKKESEKRKHTINILLFFLNVCCSLGVLRVRLCCSVCWVFSGHFFMVPLNLTYLHCLQHSFFEHLFLLY